jgi:putative flippase GtrA
MKSLKQFIKFCLVGVVNTAIDFAVYYFLTRVVGIYFLLANLISVLVAMTFSFVFNKYWTFKNFNPKINKQYLKFALVNLVYFLLNTAIIWLGVSIMGLGDLWSKLLATAVGLAWSFGANKIWTFRD